ncbi:MAG: heme-degrading monooxygenase HmoA [Sphingobacteriales bacterium]|jgi:heme-degrading monooxygenase HmoA
MIKRVVKLEIKDSSRAEFEGIVAKYKPFIEKSKGCSKLDILQDVNNPTIYFTYSYWNTEEDLDEYRHGSLFKEVWALFKPHFNAKAEAWSLNQIL